MKKNNLLLSFRIGYLLCSVGAAILQSLAVLFSYGNSEHYFANGDPLSIAAIAFAFLSVALGVASILLSEKNNVCPCIFSRASFPNPLAGGVVAAALLFGGYRFLASGYERTLSPFDLLLILCLLLTTAYAVLSGMQKAGGRITLTAFFGLFAIVACILLNAYYYFDTSIEMNAPLKTSVQVGLLFTMLYLTGEIRYLLGTQMPRMMQLFAVCTVSFGSLCAIAVPVAFFTGKLSRPDYLAGALLVLGAIPTAILRLHTLAYPPKSISNETDTKTIDDNTGKDQA